MPLAAAVADLIDRSDHLDALLRLRLAAYREGFAAGEAAHADDFERGFTEGVMALKHTQHDAARLVQVESQRWQVRGERRARQTFGRPHPGDFPGRGDAA